jgi:hypothetical protein
MPFELGRMDPRQVPSSQVKGHLPLSDTPHAAIHRCIQAKTNWALTRTVSTSTITRPIPTASPRTRPRARGGPGRRHPRGTGTPPARPQASCLDDHPHQCKLMPGTEDTLIGYKRTPPPGKPIRHGPTSVTRREGTRTPETHKCPAQRPRHSSVELRGIEPLTFSMRKTGTAVDRGCFRTS